MTMIEMIGVYGKKSTPATSPFNSTNGSSSTRSEKTEQGYVLQASPSSVKVSPGEYTANSNRGGIRRLFHRRSKRDYGQEGHRKSSSDVVMLVRHFMYADEKAKKADAVCVKQTSHAPSTSETGRVPKSRFTHSPNHTLPKPNNNRDLDMRTHGKRSAPPERSSSMAVHRKPLLTSMAGARQVQRPSTASTSETYRSPPGSRQPKSGRSVSDTNSRVWGPPPALASYGGDGQAYAGTNSLNDKRTGFYSAPSERDALLHTNSRPLPYAWQVDRKGKYDAQSIFPRSQTTTSLSSSNVSVTVEKYSSATVSSTTRGRATGRTPTVGELSKRSSQFIGYWCPYPSDAPPSPALSVRSLPVKSSCVARSEFEAASVSDEEEEDVDEEEMERLEESIARTRPDTAGSKPSGRCTATRSSFDREIASARRSNVGQDDAIWAVARGWRVGLYASKADALAQVKNFPGPMCKCFTTRREASEWLRQDAAQSHRIPSLRTLQLEDDECALALNKASYEDVEPTMFAAADASRLSSRSASSLISTSSIPADARMTKEQIVDRIVLRRNVSLRRHSPALHA